jgi:hypothetical protein
MRYLLSALSAILLLSGFSGDKGPKEVNGEVFIVTQSAGNVKLGLVTVAFLTEHQYKTVSDTHSVSYLHAIEDYNLADSLHNYSFNNKMAERYLDLVDTYKRLNTDRFAKEISLYDSTAKAFAKQANSYERFRTDIRAKRVVIELLIKSNKVIWDKTNSDGKFKVTLQNKKYWVYANSTRKVSDSDEEYHWLFVYTPDGKPLYLSNDNMNQDGN